MTRGNIYIISFWNSQNLLDGIHTITVMVLSGNKMQTYNDEYASAPMIVSGTFKDLLKGRPFICAYKMKD